MVNFPGNDAKSIGFITKEALKFSGESKTAVFVPTTPNPTSGFLMFFDPEDVVTMDLSVDEAVKIIVFMGVVTPAKLH